MTNEIVQFERPRLPYADVIGERFDALGVNRATWKVLCEAIYPAAKTPDSIIMALSYCQARKLDPFKRPVHIVPVYDKERGRMVETVWPGISELRTTAVRTGTYAGCDETAFGPDITTKLSGVEVTFPEWAQHTIYRVVGGARVPIVGPKAFWMENYATAKRDTQAPNSMWQRRPRGQIEKCAEAGALRRAFPEELGDTYAAEEMDGKTLGALETVAPSGQIGRLHADFEDAVIDEPSPESLDEILDGDDFPVIHEAGVEDVLISEPSNEAAKTDTPATDPQDWAVAFNGLLDPCTDEAEIDALLALPEHIEGFRALEAASPGMAKALNAAINGKRKAVRSRLI